MLGSSSLVPSLPVVSDHRAVSELGSWTLRYRGFFNQGDSHYVTHKVKGRIEVRERDHLVKLFVYDLTFEALPRDKRKRKARQQQQRNEEEDSDSDSEASMASQQSLLDQETPLPVLSMYVSKKEGKGRMTDLHETAFPLPLLSSTLLAGTFTHTITSLGASILGYKSLCLAKPPPSRAPDPWRERGLRLRPLRSSQAAAALFLGAARHGHHAGLSARDGERA